MYVYSIFSDTKIAKRLVSYLKNGSFLKEDWWRAKGRIFLPHPDCVAGNGFIQEAESNREQSKENLEISFQNSSLSLE